MLALYRNSVEQVRREGEFRHRREAGEIIRVKLPPEKYGHVFVFRVFDRISYALVMNVSRPVVVADLVQTPK